MPLGAEIARISLLRAPNKVKVDGRNVKFEYDTELERLVVQGLELDLNKDSKMTWE